MLNEMDPASLEGTHRPATEAAHAGEIAERDLGTSVAQPIYQTTVHSFKSLKELDRVQTKGVDDVRLLHGALHHADALPRPELAEAGDR